MKKKPQLSLEEMIPKQYDEFAIKCGEHFHLPVKGMEIYPGDAKVVVPGHGEIRWKKEKEGYILQYFPYAKDSPQKQRV